MNFSLLLEILLNWSLFCPITSAAVDSGEREAARRAFIASQKGLERVEAIMQEVRSREFDRLDREPSVIYLDHTGWCLRAVRRHLEFFILANPDMHFGVFHTFFILEMKNGTISAVSH